MMKTLSEDGGLEIVDEVHSLVVDRISTCDEWQREASRHGAAFDNLWDRLMAAPEFEDDDALDAVTDLVTKHARNIKSPNFQRWETIFPALDLMIDNWTINYFIAVDFPMAGRSPRSLTE